MNKYKYNPGDRIGPYNILLVERLPEYKLKNGNKPKNAYGKFLCPNHPENDPHYFITAISHVASGHTKQCKDSIHRIVDLTGQRFGRLVVKELDRTNKNKEAYWICQCDCGSPLKSISGTSLKKKRIISCGCYNNELICNDLIGECFGELTVIEKTDKRSGGRVVWKCKCSCGKERLVASNHLQDGSTLYCKDCSQNHSKGEYLISQILGKLKISFETEKTFEKCINKRPLRFDFYLPSYNICIEYDGIQHFKYNKTGWATKEKYQQTIFNDNLKTQYCKNNNIKLVRIPYYDYNLIDENYIKNKIQGVI